MRLQQCNLHSFAHCSLIDVLLEWIYVRDQGTLPQAFIELWLGSGFASQVHQATGRRSYTHENEGRDAWDPSSSRLSAYDRFRV